MTEIIDYGRFRERLESVLPRWDESDRMSSEEFFEHVADTGPRWELLRQFQEEWGYVPSGDQRWPRGLEAGHRTYVRELKAEQLGAEEDEPDSSLPIPGALAEWWDLPFNSFVQQPRLYWTNPEWPPTERPDPTGYGIAGALPEEGFSFIKEDTDRRVCVFMAEYQYCNEWGYPAAFAEFADPAVMVTDADDEGNAVWAYQSRSISEFFLQLAAMRLPAHFGWTVEENEVESRAVERLGEALPWMGFLRWRELGARTHLFGAPDAIVSYNEGEGDFELQAYGRTPKALEDVARTLGLDWTDPICEPESMRGED